jgi:hypothetical protein
MTRGLCGAKKEEGEGREREKRQDKGGAKLRAREGGGGEQVFWVCLCGRVNACVSA